MPYSENPLPQTHRNRRCTGPLLMALLCVGAAALGLPPQTQAQPSVEHMLADELQRLDFRLLDAHANYRKRDYVLDQEDSPPMITPLGGGFYRLDLTLKRASKNSLRGDLRLVVNFHYDGHAFTFFNDRNGNGRLDRREERHVELVRHKHEVISKGGRSYMEGAEVAFQINKRVISQPSNVHLNLRLLFIP